MASSSARKKSENKESFLEEGWAPTTFQAFQIMFVFRFFSAFYNNINDCDETFNYWEPAHYLMHGSGFQTWEYSPVYAIRSYAYLFLHILPLYIFGTINKFYTLRVILAIVCCICETYFYRAIKRRFGTKLSLLTLAFMAPCNGMFISSTAFLPSSFTMYCGLIAMGAWFEDKGKIAIFSVAFGSILGWPFFALFGLPMAIEIVFIKRKWFYFIFWAGLSFIIISAPVYWIDSMLYGKPVFAPLNIILYNVFSSSGADLYGTEPWTFYFANGVLNFNILFLFSLLSFPLLLLKIVIFKQDDSRQNSSFQLKTLFTLLIWMIVFFAMSHKEERFLFPIYPLICITSAMAVIMLQDQLSIMMNFFRKLIKWLPVMTVIIHALLGLSRSAALYYNYGAPLQVYTNINSQPVLSFTGYTKEINVCVGKEWYRFPANFFLPDKIIQPLKTRWYLRFIKSEFKGQLPQYFHEGREGTSIIPQHMNSINKEEPSRYFNITKCHFLVDLELSTPPSQQEPHYSKNQDQWELLYQFPFLDSSRTPLLYRALYIPGVTTRDKKEFYGRYVLLRNKKGPFVKDRQDISFDK